MAPLPTLFYEINPLELPGNPVARDQVPSAIISTSNKWCSSPQTVPGWGNSLAVPVNNGTGDKGVASCGRPDATVADRTQCANANMVARPAVSTIAPAVGPVAGATAITITGAGFTGATGVTFDGVPGTAFTVVSATSITVTTPAGQIGPARVVVLSPNGNVTVPSGFTYQ